MSLDDNDDEEWLYGRTEETPDLETLITDSLFRLYPSYVAPQWAAYFAERLRRFEAVALEHEQQRLPRWREKVKGALLHESAS